MKCIANNILGANLKNLKNIFFDVSLFNFHLSESRNGIQITFLENFELMK